ncbi:MAG: FHA domain-containing protein [Minicystis sp.]
MSRGKGIQPRWDVGSEPSDDGSGTVASARNGGDSSLLRLDLAWSVIGVARVGFGTAAWLSISPGAEGLVVAGAGQALRIGETGQVPEVEVSNLGDASMLVPAHLVLTGGWQTRAVERSAVVPAHSAARLPVKCVEAGRWAPRDEKTARSFEIDRRTSLRTRLSTSQNMSEQLARHGRYSAEQSAVWQHVEQELTRTPEASQTRSYEAYLHGEKRRHFQAAQQAEVRAPAGANAVLLFPREGGFWLEAYPTTVTLASQVDDLLADLFDPSTRDQREAVDQATIEALLRQIWAIPLRPLEHIAGASGDAFALVEAGQEGASPRSAPITGAALVVEGALAHLSLGRSPERVEQIAAAPAVRASERGVVEGASAPQIAAPRKDAEGSLPDPYRDTKGSTSAFSSSILPHAMEVQGEGSSNDRPKVTRETMRAVYARARDLLPDETPARETVQGYRLLRSLDGNVSWVDIRIGGEGYAVLGSHDRCDLVLPSDQAIWLRHLIATCVRLDDGSVALRLIDLKTDVPFFLEDDAPQWSVTASGPFAVRIGRHVVCGFPIGPTAEEAPRDLGGLSGRTQHVGPLDGSTRVRATVESLSLPNVGEARSQRLHDEPFTVTPSAPVSQIQELLGPNASPNHVRVTLERGGMGASVEISVEALDAGVLLGRALNCFDGGLRRIFCDAVSRAHVLLLRDHDDVYAFDLCTTNGTRVAGKRIRRLKLSNEGSVVELGKKVTFRWHRRRPSGPPPEPVRPGGSFVLVDAPPGTPPIDPKKLN